MKSVVFMGTPDFAVPALRVLIENPDYDVKLVPTCIFKDKNGNIIRKTEGNIQSRILENYMKEQLNG